MDDDIEAPLAGQDNDHDVPEEIIYIVNQAETIFAKKNRQIGDTHFYKVVLAGNVQIISQVITYMENNDMRDVTSWLLDRASSQRKYVKSGYKALKQSLTFAVLFIFTFITTPGFYLLHYVANVWINQKQKRISNHIELPLVYAAFSQKKAMISYFMSLGLKLYDCDSKGNNLFHYIADLSSISSEKAIDIFDIVIKELASLDDGRKLLQKWKNTSGLSAIEYTVKYGSPSLLSHILSYPHLIDVTEFEATGSSFSHGNKPNDITESTTDKTTLKYIDVTPYEIGSIRNQSKLLNLLSDRNVLELTKSDLEIFHQTALVGKWIKLKVRQMFSGILVFHLFDVLLTVLLVLIVNSQFADSLNFSFTQVSKNKVMIEEIKALAMSQSMLFKPDRYDSVFRTACANKQNELLHRNILQQNTTLQAILINETMRHHPEDARSISLALPDTPLASSDVTYEVMSNILETAMDMPELEEFSATLNSYNSLPSILKNVTTTITKNFPKGAQNFNTKNFMTYHYKITSLISTRKLTYENTTMELGSIMTTTDIKNLVCIEKKYFTQEDLLISPHIRFPQDDLFHDVCTLKALMQLAFDFCKSTSVDGSYRQAEGPDLHQWRELYIVFVILCCLGIAYCLIDFWERVVFVYTCILNHSHVREMLTTFCSCKVPGSYTRKQANTFTYGSLAVVFIGFNNVDVLLNQTGATYSEIVIVFKYIITINLILRLVMHIHAMRLLPGIGHFVITTFMMGTNLIHFSVVLSIVMIIFAVMFELLIYNPDCPYENAEGFVTLLESLFSTFRLTCGHGDLEPFFTNTPAMLTYGLYMIIVGLMALNLIIAIMSTTAMDVMNEPWKQRLWDIEWLDEATSVEYTFSALLLPFRLCCHIHNSTLEKSGYVVKEQNGKQYVFIELFHSAALDSLK